MNTLIGHVMHYYTHLGVAVVEISNRMSIGDTLLFLGHTTDFTQILCSIEAEHHKLSVAEAGMKVAVRVDEPVRPGDQVFKLLAEDERPEITVLWKLIGQVQESIVSAYEPILDDFAGQVGLNNREIGLLLAALTMEPQSISPEILMIRGPYTAPVLYMTRLQSAADKGFLAEPEPGEFRLAERGHAAMEKLITTIRNMMASIDPLPLGDGLKIADILGRLVQASLFTPPPPDTWSIRLAYQLMPGLQPPLPYIEQAISCLKAYRDDSHLAAWRPSGISGLEMECLTLIWRNLAGSVDDIFDQLSWRGFELHDYRQVLESLRVRGWLGGLDETLRLTPEGLVFREKVEKETDRYFFAPWGCLSDLEITEFSCLLVNLKAGLKARQ